MVNECCGTPTIRERHLCCRKRFLETNSFAQSWQGMFRSVSGPLLPVLLAASATGGSISLELSLDTSKLWKRSFGDTLETRWGLLYPLASQQREKFNTPHTKIASESVQCEISCQILSQDRKAQFLYLCARFSVYDPFHWLLSRLIRCQLPQVCNWSNIIISKLREDFGGLVHWTDTSTIPKLRGRTLGLSRIFMV